MPWSLTSLLAVLGLLFVSMAVYALRGPGRDADAESKNAQFLGGLGDFVLHERSERYTGRDGHPDWEFNVTGLLWIRDGRIRRWRDDSLPGARQVFTT